MSIVIIANPSAGRGRGKKTALLAEQILTERNADFQLIFTEYPGHATELAEKACRSHRLLTALGGDGTIREVLAGMWQSPASLGIIPGGTGNDYARGLGIPLQTGLAVETVLAGNTSVFDIGFQNDRVFGVLASVGFPVDVINYVNTNRSSVFKGKLAFLSAVAATIRNLNSFSVKIKIDAGETMEKQVIGLFVMNMPYGGGGMQFAPEAHYSSGVFDLLIVDNITRLDLALTLPKIYAGKHVSHPAVTILKGSSISIEADKPLPIMLDGDIFPPEPFKTRLIPQKAKIIVPKATTPAS